MFIRINAAHALTYHIIYRINPFSILYDRLSKITYYLLSYFSKQYLLLSDGIFDFDFWACLDVLFLHTHQALLIE